jgi:predicted lipid carrier protein YhbT
MLIKQLMPKNNLLASAVPSQLIDKTKKKLVENSTSLLSLAHKIMPTQLEKHFVLYQVKRLSQPFIDEGEIDFLDDKVVKVVIPELAAHWYFSKIGNQLVMLEEEEALTFSPVTSNQPDVVFSGSINALVLMASQKVDPDTLFFNRQLQITGDTELGLEVKNLFDQFDLARLDKPFRKVLDLWSDELLVN